MVCDIAVLSSKPVYITTTTTATYRICLIGLIFQSNSGLSGLPMCSTTTIQLQYNNFFLYCTCADPAIQCCNTSFLQLAEILQATCSSCKKNLYCSCIARADCFRLGWVPKRKPFKNYCTRFLHALCLSCHSASS